MNTSTVAKDAFHEAARTVCRLAMLVGYRVRAWGAHHVPATGGALICSNHQSHLDPVAVGVNIPRHLRYLARKSLFEIPLLGTLISSLNTIPIDRDGMGLAGLKETLRRLRRGEAVILFPEGTRSDDGEVAPLKPGFCALARRGKVPLVPVGIAGTFEAWPRSKSLPRPGVIYVVIGSPISPDDVARMTDEELIEGLRERIISCCRTARGRRSRR